MWRISTAGWIHARHHMSVVRRAIIIFAVVIAVVIAITTPLLIARIEVPRLVEHSAFFCIVVVVVMNSLGAGAPGRLLRVMGVLRALLEVRLWMRRNRGRTRTSSSATHVLGWREGWSARHPSGRVARRPRRRNGRAVLPRCERRRPWPPVRKHDRRSLYPSCSPSSIKDTPLFPRRYIPLLLPPRGLLLLLLLLLYILLLRLSFLSPLIRSLRLGAAVIKQKIPFLEPPLHVALGAHPLKHKRVLLDPWPRLVQVEPQYPAEEFLRFFEVFEGCERRFRRNFSDRRVSAPLASAGVHGRCCAASYARCACEGWGGWPSCRADHRDSVFSVQWWD